MAMSPLHPSLFTDPITVKKLTLFSAVIDVIMIELRLLILNPMGMFSILQSNREFYHICHINNSNSQISQSDWYSRNLRV